MKLLRFKNQIVFSYFNIFWLISIISLILVVVDRIAIDWTNGDAILDRDSKAGLPYTDSKAPATTITGWLWLITARTLLVSLNMSFLTVLWMIPNFLEEAAPKFIDMDVRHSNLAIHKFTGIWLNAIPTVVHVVILFLPWADGLDVKFYYEGFDFSNWWDPCVKPFSSFSHKDGANFTLDEIFRLVLIILVFCLMMPISRADWMLRKSYSTAMVVHAVAGFAFMVDLVRKNTHQLSWRLNLPVIILYIIDRLFATFLYRVNKFKVHQIRPCSKNSFLVLGKLDNVPRTGQGCGDNYWLLHRFSSGTPCVPIFQRAHPYTAFQNWDKENDHIWNVGFIINSNPGNKHSWSSWLMNQTNSGSEANKFSEAGTINPAYHNDNHGIELTSFSKKEPSDSLRVTNIDPSQQTEFHIRSWGPYRSSFYAVDLCDTYSDLILIAAGSGFGYILSAITLLNDKHHFGNNSAPGKDKKITVLFTARQIEVIDMFAELLIEVPNFTKCTFHIRYTGIKDQNLDEDENSVGSSSNLDSSDKFLGIKHFEKFDQSTLNFGTGRLNLEQILRDCDQKETALSCVCGSGSLIKAVKNECGKNGIRLRVEEI